MLKGIRRNSHLLAFILNMPYTCFYTMRNIKHILTLTMTGLVLSTPLYAQGVNGFVHEQSSTNGYVWPSDTEVRKNLDKWQDQKFGVLFHWGLYSVPGICESWSICSEDEEWIPRDKNMSYEEYKKWYWGLSEKFNPQKFNPEQWAEVMHEAGMKYMVFTTKHHDGFCMFDSQYTDFSIARHAFKDHPRRNVAYHVFEAFRQKDFMIGCYFSKPDWHCPWFWNPYFATSSRRINYKKSKHPDWWKNYQDFTENQLNELMSSYGKFDILWLDGGWITGEDIHLDRVLAKARKQHPGLISVDRTMRGKNENYQTPERSIPDRQLDYPWESCVTLANDWGWTPNAPYKSAQKVINTLAEIVAKGGCYLLGIGPTPEGIIEQPVVERMQQVGKWLRTNGEAIYATRNTEYYNDGKIWFTANKDGKTLYAIYTLNDGESLPETISWKRNIPKGKIILLQTGKKVKYSCQNNVVTLNLPRNLRNEPLVFRFELVK